MFVVFDERNERGREGECDGFEERERELHFPYMF